MRVRLAPISSLVVTATLAACARDEAAPAPPPPPQVSVAPVQSREVTDFDELTGHFEAVERVELRPRVAGYIASVNFVQGREVKKGDVLFVIDPRPYAAELKRAQAQLVQARSQLALAKSERERALKLMEAHAVSREELDTRTASSEQAVANVDAAQAAVDAAQLNLEFTRVTAPISGVIGRANVTAGNLVTAGSTLLTTLVSVDPIYVAFESDEAGYLKYLGSLRAAPAGEAHQTVFVGLADESGYPHEGSMVFVNNEVDEGTATVRARGLLDNHARQFTPGMFARVKLPGGKSYAALLINDSAVGTDQSVKYVLRLGKDNTLEYRPVQLGPMVDGLRVVTEGLAPGDIIAVNGLAKVRPGARVTPVRTAMGESQEGSAHLTFATAR
jgi:membrane fusion protein, multidrug efflux system